MAARLNKVLLVCILQELLDSRFILSFAGTYTLSATGVPVGQQMLIEITGPGSADTSFSSPFVPSAGENQFSLRLSSCDLGSQTVICFFLNKGYMID